MSRRTSHPLSPACKPQEMDHPMAHIKVIAAQASRFGSSPIPARPPMRAPSRHMSASAAFLGAAPCFFNDVDGRRYHAMPCRADLHGPSQTHDMTTMVAFESACNLFLRTNAQHDLASPRARITCTRQAMNRGWIGCAQRGLANLLTA